MKLFKLTNQNGTTYNGYVYGIVGKIHKKRKVKNPSLCSSDVFHAYRNKNLAFLLNPIHAEISNPRLWEIEGDVVCEDYGKVGSFKQTVMKELQLPNWIGSEKELKVRVQFAVLCAESVLSYFVKYDKKDKRVIGAIEAAKNYLCNKKDVAAARAAYAAAYAAAAYAAADAADAYAARAYAARAAANAADAYAEINFLDLADRAVEMVMNEI